MHLNMYAGAMVRKDFRGASRVGVRSIRPSLCVRMVVVVFIQKMSVER